MELASERWRVSMASKADAGRVTALLRQARWTHYHADWHLPGDWLGFPGFVLARAADGDALAGCLCVAPDPLPAAWVRLAAVNDPAGGLEIMGEMMAAALDAARKSEVAEVALLGRDTYLDRWLPALGFSVVNEVVTYLKYDLDGGSATGRTPTSPCATCGWTIWPGWWRLKRRLLPIWRTVWVLALR